MHTEHLHRTLTPQAYAHLRGTLRQQAEEERRLAVQTFFLTWPRQLFLRANHALRPSPMPTH
ncbi:MAG: hypothetical protein C0453_12100 [Comamonadaceae bacterium]|nr:hypothetical protein [Comamonadaceae bacterium]